MRRKPFILLTRAGLILGVVCLASLGGSGAQTQALLKAVRVYGQGAESELWLGVEGGYSFKAIQATDGTVFIDLMGARVAGVPQSRQWTDGLLTGYHLLQYTDAAHQPVVRVQVEVKHSEPFTTQRESEGLRVRFGMMGAAGLASSPATQDSPAALPTVVGTETKGTQPKVASNGQTLVSDIFIQSGAEGEAVVDILTSRQATYRILHLENPARVVVDLEQARFIGRPKSYAAQSPVLKDVRVGQFSADPAVVRVVADIVGSPTSDVQAQQGRVRIELKPRSPARRPAGHDVATPALLSTLKVEKKPDQPVAGAAPSPITRAEGKRNGRSSTLRLQPPPASGTAAAQAEARPTPKPDYQSALPAAVGSKEVTAAPRPESPGQTPETLRAAKAAKILQADPQAITPPPPGQAPGEEPPPQAGTPPGQAPASAPAAPSAQAATGAPAAMEKPQYTGEPISLNLKDVDLKDFFRLIHEISGLNIIVDPNVAGSVTLVLDSVPWDQALDIVLKNNHLDKALEGNVLRIARLETLAAEQESIKKLAEAREEAQPLVTVFRPVNYAKATAIATMLKSWVGGGALTKRGTILVDERANTLIISDIQSQIPVIETIVTKLDKKAKQISIEARVVLATASFSRSLQAALSAGTVSRSGSVVTGGSTGTGASVTPNIVPPPRITIGQTSAGGFGAYAVSNVGARYFLNAALAAAETKSQAKTISRPTIITQNNVLGMVQQGTQIPIQTSINNTISIQYVAATLQLQVTPQVTDDGNIFMVINVQNASPGPALTGAGPSINTQSATTQVLVPDGGTVVFGGVTVNSRTKSATYVPLIGNIPILGHLFKTTNVQDNDNELLFFVTPKVMAG